MARAAMIAKAKKEAKFSTRAYTRCAYCGRSRGVLKRFLMCRLCFRKKSNEGLIPGVIKASW